MVTNLRSGAARPGRRPTFTGLAVPMKRRQCLGCGIKFRVPGDLGEEPGVECPRCGGTQCPTWEPAPPRAPAASTGWLLPTLLAAAVMLAAANAWVSLRVDVPATQVMIEHAGESEH